jgi:enoyl-CoA hydratase/carnithine racemase
VNGHCLGYGLTLVSWCDFVIASDRATFGYPEVGIGVPTIVGAIRLPQRINWQYAMELLLTGERIDAARAREIGLAGWVVPHDDLTDVAHRLADRLVRAAPLAARATKEVAVRTQHMSTVEAIRFGETMRKVAGATEDAREGARAFAEGRPPVWKGR